MGDQPQLPRGGHVPAPGGGASQGASHLHLPQHPRPPPGWRGVPHLEEPAPGVHQTDQACVSGPFRTVMRHFAPFSVIVGILCVNVESNIVLTSEDCVFFPPQNRRNANWGRPHLSPTRRNQLLHYTKQTELVSVNLLAPLTLLNHILGMDGSSCLSDRWEMIGVYVVTPRDSILHSQSGDT